MALVISILVTIGCAFALGRALFGSVAALLEAVRYWLRPGIQSLIFGDAWESAIAQLKLALWGATSIAIGVITFVSLE